MNVLINNGLTRIARYATFAMLVGALATTACKKDEPTAPAPDRLIGSWTITEVDEAGDVFSPSVSDITMRADGTGSLSMSGVYDGQAYNVARNITSWRNVGNTVTVETDGIDGTDTDVFTKLQDDQNTQRWYEATEDVKMTLTRK